MAYNDVDIGMLTAAFQSKQGLHTYPQLAVSCVNLLAWHATLRDADCGRRLSSEVDKYLNFDRIAHIPYIIRAICRLLPLL